LQKNTFRGLFEATRTFATVVPPSKTSDHAKLRGTSPKHTDITTKNENAPATVSHKHVLLKSHPPQPIPSPLPNKSSDLPSNLEYTEKTSLTHEQVQSLPFYTQKTLEQAKTLLSSTPLKHQYPFKYYEITLLRSTIGLPKSTRERVKALGLHKKGKTVYREVNPKSAGQILLLRELLRVNLVNEIKSKRKITLGYSLQGHLNGGVVTLR